jgi:hypothetical protein
LLGSVALSEKRYVFSSVYKRFIVVAPEKRQRGGREEGEEQEEVWTVEQSNPYVNQLPLFLRFHQVQRL